MNDIKIAGYKANMTNIPASIGIEQLKYINSILKKHNFNGKYLDKKLSKIKNLRVLKEIIKAFLHIGFILLLLQRKKILKKI